MTVSMFSSNLQISQVNTNPFNPFHLFMTLPLCLFLHLWFCFDLQWVYGIRVKRNLSEKALGKMLSISASEKRHWDYLCHANLQRKWLLGTYDQMSILWNKIWQKMNIRHGHHQSISRKNDKSKMSSQIWKHQEMSLS